jgi:DNA-binding NtrC family response regulator
VFGVLAVVRGNKSQAARILGVPRRSLYRMIERLGTDPDGHTSSSHNDTIESL